KGYRIHGAEFLGFKYGWRGLVQDETMPIDVYRVRGLSRQGGTILGTSRTNPFEGEGGGPDGIQATLDRHHVDALIVIGGEGTLTAAKRLADAGIRIVGVP